MAIPSSKGLLRRLGDAVAALRGAPTGRGPELGWGGAKITAGVLQDEHNADLQGLQGIQTAARMRRADGQIRAVMTAISLPIRAARWFVEEPDQPSAAEKEAAEALRANLFGGMECSWDDVLREGCLGIYYGWRVPEIVWREDAGRIGIASLAGRSPELVERWCYERGGRLAGYVYAGSRPVGAGLTLDAGGQSVHERLAVPIEKTVHFVYDGENDTATGFGLWRSMYPHWYIKQALYKILAIGIERNLLDVPVGKLPAGAQADDRNKLLTILRRWRAAEDAAVVLTGDQELEFIGSQRSLMDAMPFLQHHNVMIAQAGLAQFLNLGQTGEGTQGLASEHVKLFMLAEQANANWIRETLQQQLVKRWALLNYGPGLRAPVLMHEPIRARDLGAWTSALQQLVSGGFLHATVDDEERLRDEMELPAIPREQLEQRAEAAQAEKAAERQERLQMLAGGRTEPEKATECGHSSLRFSDDGRDAEADFERRATELLGGIQRDYLAALRPLVERAVGDPKVSQGVPLTEIADVAVPGARRYEEFVRSWIREVFAAGRTAVADGEPNNGPIPNKTRSWMNARARVIAHGHVGLLQHVVLARVLSGIRAAMPAEQIFTDAGAAAIEELNAALQADWGSVAAEVLALAAEGP